jgi:hypothetical protein
VRNRVGGYLTGWTSVERELADVGGIVVGMTKSTESRMGPSNERVEDGARFRRRPARSGVGFGVWGNRAKEAKPARAKPKPGGSISLV